MIRQLSFVLITFYLCVPLLAQKNQLAMAESIVFEAKPFKTDVSKAYNSTFKKADIVELDYQRLNNVVYASNFSEQIQIRLQNGEIWNLDIYEHDIRGENYQAFDLGNAVGMAKVERPSNTTFRGVCNNTGIVRLAIQDDFVFGFVDSENGRYVIEPYSTFDEHSPKGVFVIYRPEDLKEDRTHSCGFDDARLKQEHQEGKYDVEKRLDTSTGTTVCRNLEIAQAYDAGMSARYGSNANLSTWDAAIWNVVDGLYNGQFSMDINFVIVVEAFNIPFPTSTNINTYLVNFQTWGNGGGFGAGIPFDIGNLWTTIDVEGGGNFGVIGSVMDIPGVCQNDRYQIFEDFVGPTGIPPTGGALSALAILIAHECGHNLGMFHNNDTANPNIMEPFLNAAAVNFTQVSIQYFDRLLVNPNCFSSCFCIEVTQAEPINCSADGTTMDLQVTLEHENTAGTFTVSAGTANMSMAYGANPQTFVLAGVPVGTGSITAVDDGDASCTFTVNIDLPTQPTFNAIQQVFCEDETTVQNITAAPIEQYGSIIITMNGDQFAASEQTAQITDANGAVVADYPFGTFANNGQTIVNSGPLKLSPQFAPYTVIVADWFGDGMGSAQCQATNGGPGGFEITDGQGIVHRPMAGLQNANGSCAGNDAAWEVATLTPSVDNTVSGDFTGPGVTDATAADGQGSFDPAVAGVGEHFINYTFQTCKGCTATQIEVDIYEYPELTLNTTNCAADATVYDVVIDVDLGTWNSILDGVDGSFTVTTDQGAPVTATINADGQVTIQNVPNANNVNITIGTGGENNGCHATINVPTPNCTVACSAPNIDSVVDSDPTCGTNNGSIVINASGGAGVYQYSIDNGVTFQGSNTFNGLAPGTYDIVLEDSGCSSTQQITITDQPGPTIDTTVDNDPTCGNNNGDITITASGGTGATQYSVDNGATFQAGNSFTGLAPGTYDLVIQDANGCQATTQVTITDQPGPTIDATAETDPSCGNNNGDITITASGGTGATQYSVDNGATFQAGNSFTGLAPGTYDLVIQDANGCQATTQVTITDQPGPAIDATAETDPTCGNNNGDITITASGGTGATQYSVDNGVTFQAGNSFTGLAPGTYDLVIQDANGCQATTQVTIADQPGPTIDATAETDPTCGNNNGDITITASGGTGATQYSVDNGVTFQAGNSFTGLGPGTYDLVIQDANGCQAVAQVTITDQAGPTIDATAENDPTCGNNNGDITITASGGTGATQYSVDNGVTFQASNSFTGLPPGTYDLVIQDANGCQTTTQVTITDQPGATIDNVVTNDPTCNNSNGDITITASGGTGAVQFSIDGGVTFQAGGAFTGLASGSYNIVVQDANGCQTTSTANLTDLGGPSIDNVASTEPTCGNSNGDITVVASGGTGAIQFSIDGGLTFQPTGSFTGLAPGNYNIVILDANGCQSASNALLTDQAGPTIDNVATNDPTCNNANGDITVVASGGTGAVQFSIDGGATFQAAGNFTGLASGSYNIVIQDANGCQTVAVANLTDIGGPAIDNVGSTEPICGDPTGVINVVASGGTGAIQFSIDGGATFQSAGNFSGLPAGNYNIVIQDANGCQTTSSVMLTDQPGANIDNVALTDPTCNNSNGDITITVSGGTGTVQYSIDGGATFQAGAVFTGLPSGSYNIVVQDANGCLTTSTVNLTDIGGPAIDNVNSTEPTCGDPNGDVTITASGGTGAVQYSIDGGVTFQGTGSFTGLPPGNYNIVVQDANGCQTTSNVTLTDQAGPSIDNALTSDPSCNDSTGSITVVVSGGTGAVQYSIDGGATFQTSDTFANLGAGAYNVVVEDANGCQQTLVVNLVDSGSPSIDNLAQTDPTCENSNGSITVVASGGVGAIQYSIDGGATFQSSGTFTNLVPGTYDVIVEDANGCQFTTTVNLVDPGNPSVDVVNSTQPGCGSSNGVINITASGGTGSLQYSIDGGATFQAGGVFTGLPSGSYNLVIMDANGCTVTSVFDLTDADAPSFDDVALTQPTCGNSNGELVLTVSGGTGAILYSIDGGVTFQSSDTFFNLSPGSYTITIQDANGCINSVVVELVDPGLPDVDNVATTIATCDDAVGSISITASGGIAPYQYSIDGGATFQNTANFVNLPAGLYNIVVLDAAGCPAYAQAQITSTSGPMIDGVSVTGTSCGQSNGSAIITVFGGQSPYQYSFDGGVLYQSSNQNNNLPAGTHTVVVVDAAGCLSVTQITIVGSDAPQAIVAYADASCGLQNGSIAIELGNTSGHQFSIDGGVTFHSSPNFTDLPSGTYNILVVDANGCQQSLVQEIVQLGSPNIDDISAQDASCGNSDGEVGVEVSGGVAPYSYSIDGMSFGNQSIFEDLNAGTYSITVADDNGCTATATIQVNEIIPDPAVCNDNDDCTIDLYNASDCLCENVPNPDCTEIDLAEVSFVIYDDENENGVQDEGEDPISGITVTLIDENGNTYTATTDENGEVNFGELPPGEYSIVVDVPSGGSAGDLDYEGSSVIVIDGTSDIFNISGTSTGSLPIVFTEAEVNCDDFVASADVICSDDGSTFDVIVTLFGSGDFEGADFVVSGSSSTTTSGSFTDGPFTAGEGYSYSIHPAGYPECGIQLGEQNVGCVTTAIELLSFQGSTESEGNLLSWKTANEVDNDHFILQKSNNGVDFHNLSIVAAKGLVSGASYDFIDKEEISGTKYYRLVSVDAFGLEEVHPGIVALTREVAAIVQIVPHPVSDRFRLQMNAEVENLSWSVYSVNGQLVEDGIGTELNAESWPVGMYFLYLRWEGGTEIVKVSKGR